ncbi:MAG: GGDEF domain-containing protein [Clostridia bacterium]|nr:GGDEF domain-containing protein [Clostridia bacterium]
MKKVLIFIIALLFSTNTFSADIIDQISNPLIDKVDRSEGLSNLSVSSIEEDKYGFLWFATQGGLNRYDGKEFKIFRNNPFNEEGLVNNLIQTTFYDEEKHEIWLGTYQGISRYIISEDKFINYHSREEGLSNQIVTAICKDSQGYYWAGTLEGLNRINSETGEIVQYQINGNVVRDILLDSKGRIILATYEGMMLYNQEKDIVEPLDINLPSKFVMVIKEFQPGIITGGLWDGGLFEFNFYTDELKTWNFTNNNIYTIEKTKDNVLWAGSWGGGLFSITEKGEIHEISSGNKTNQVSHPVVYSLLEDNSGILWIGTNGGGINKINPRKINYTFLANDPENPNSLSSGKINAIYEDTDGNYWILVYNQGIAKYTRDGRLIKYNKENNKIPENTVTTVLQIDNKLYFGTAKGVMVYDYQKDFIEPVSNLPQEENVYSLSNDGTNLWIGTYSGGIYKYNWENEELQQFNNSGDENSLSDNLVYSILSDSQGRVWIGTNNGLNLWDENVNGFKKFFREEGNKEKIPSNNIRIINEDSKGNIWIGSVGGGLSKYIEETGKFETYTEEDGLSGNVVIGVVEDSQGRIWASTHDGISILNPDTGVIDRLTPEDGIGGWEFNSGFFRDKNDNLLFGGIHGIIRIPDGFITSEVQDINLYITDMELYQKEIVPDLIIYNDFFKELEYDENYLSFRFVALDYDAPKKVNYFYKLEGFDEEWINNGTRDYVSFSNLKPGKYKFNVYAETIRGNTSKTEALTFEIKKAWYKTIPALIAYFVLFILAILGGMKIWKNRYLKKRNIELEKISLYDSLTGLYNRRYFDDKLNEYVHLARRSKLNITLAMLDIDNFKRFNDENGHVEGDKILIKFASLIEKNLPRSTDFAARYGGDEFVIVLYDTEKEGAKKVFEKIRDIIKNSEDIKEYLSLSMGSISIIPDEKTTIEDMIKEADDALYEAKVSGKNRIIVK